MCGQNLVKGHPSAVVLADEKQSHTQALLGLARRLVDVLWALLRDGRQFSPNAPKSTTAAA